MNKCVLIFLAWLLLAVPVACFAEDSSTVQADSDRLNAAPCICFRNPRIPKLKFALLCIHGLGLNSRSYQSFGRRMANLGAVVYAIDVRGFGSWMKSQGHEQIDFDGCLKDIQSALQTIQRANPGLPVFILGESMGGAIALRAASLYPDLVDGVISAVPAGDRFKQKRTDLKVALEVLKGGFHKEHVDIGKQVVDQGSTILGPDGKPQAVNQKLKQAWEGDIFDRLDLSPKDLIQFQRFMNDNYDCVKKIQDPILFMLGLDDALVKPDGTWDLAKCCSVSDRSVIGLPAPHLLFEDQQTEDDKVIKEAVRFVFAWIEVHLPQHATPVDAQAATISPETASTLTKGMPTVVAFYAQWCNQCDRIGRFVHIAQTRRGSNVRFVQFDVDAPDNQDLVKEFSVGTLPQIVFLKPDGTITSTILGATTGVDFADNINHLLNSMHADKSISASSANKNAGSPPAAKRSARGQQK